MKSGIYIHIPFCKSRCSYCDFATDVYRSSEAVERYVSALCAEITNYKLQITDSEAQSPESGDQRPNSASRIETIYFGGGTPSLLTTRQLEKILNAIHENFPVEREIEFTLEMNPATVT